MPAFADRLPMLVEMRGEYRGILRANASDPIKDRMGGAVSMLSIDLHFFGIADYILKHDIESFRSQLSEAAEIQKSLFERFEAGEPIDVSYVTMLSYKSLFDALAAANLPLARSLAQHMGGRSDLEEEHDHPFDYALGYTLRAFVLDDHEEMQKWPRAFAEVCRCKSMTDFLGYAQAFEGMRSGEVDCVEQGLRDIVNGHRKQTKGEGVFAICEDAMLCVWGVGVANLARSKGLPVDGVPPLIPSDLLL